MAKLKTFANGEVLTAEDVNTYLNPDVPGGALVYDTDWYTLPLTSGLWKAYDAAYPPPRVRRIGRNVILGGVMGNLPASISVAAGTPYQIGSAIPAEYRPDKAAIFAGIMGGTGANLTLCRITVDPAGLVFFTPTVSFTNVASLFISLEGPSWFV